jgi:hypothetical protein
MPDPLDVRRVAGLAECELNERVEAAGARGRAARLATAVAASVGVLAVLVRAVFDTVGPDLVAVWQGTTLLGLLYVGYVWVSGLPALRSAAATVAVWVAAGLFTWGQSLAPDPVRAARWGVAAAGAVMLVAGHLATKQYVFFATANLDRPWEESLRWRADWAALFRPGRTTGHPAVAAYRRAWLPVAAGVAGGWGLAASPLGPAPGAVLGYAAGLVGTAGLLWPRAAPVPAAWRAAGAAVRVFLTYQTTPQHAPGLFRLPTRWLRPHPARLTVAVLALLPLAWAAADLPPVYVPPHLTSYRMHPRGAEAVRLTGMTDEEYAFLFGLSHPDDREDYSELLFARRRAELDLEREGRREYERRLVTALVAACTVPPGMFLLTLAAAAGPLLAAYHTAFESGDDQ